MIKLWKLLLFILLSFVAILSSVHGWRTRQAYGFFRFFGFETLALIVVWNSGHWFRDPLSLPQIISWTLLVSSFVLAAHGVHLLRSVGIARERVMEATQRLVEVGVYRHIRHPLYASLILFGWGVFFKGIDWVSAALAVAAMALFYVTARFEEGFNIEQFGPDYVEYMKRTKMFIPFLL